MLTLTNLTKIYPARPGEFAGGIRDATIDLEPGTFFTLLGPSGCGKTTTLRCIAGLETPDRGTITVGDEVMFDGASRRSVPLHRRNIGMVFQSYAIWPHMTVFDNVAFPLRVSKQKTYSRLDIAKAVTEALTAVGLEGYAKRSATQLSGGQQQRVALARAIVHHPKLLLLDEPLSNLDAALREDMRVELKRLQRELGITAIYVTHDQTEALAMSDGIAVIDKGNIVQLGTPRDIYFRPATEFVASFIGHTNILHGRLDGPAQGAYRRVRLDRGGSLLCRSEAVDVIEVAVSIRPEDIAITGDVQGQGTPNTLRGSVTSASFLGNIMHYEIRPDGANDTTIRVEGPPGCPFEIGAGVVLSFGAENTVALPRT